MARIQDTDPNKICLDVYVTLSLGSERVKANSVDPVPFLKRMELDDLEEAWIRKWLYGAEANVAQSKYFPKVLLTALGSH
jgi:hypothetical protein